MGSSYLVKTKRRLTDELPSALPKSTAPRSCPPARSIFYAASLIPFFSLSDAKPPPQQLMATINTVHFDDLFDFSPEPLELQSSPNPHPSSAATAAVPR